MCIFDDIRAKLDEINININKNLDNKNNDINKNKYKIEKNLDFITKTLNDTFNNLK